ncbi:hypothetical protein EDB84DRAFT_1447703 [Lactarius hengduanensis]|nr:hypothetical protein EDB84DRAFT_1447703 [Lactarius hengduanensis]
MGISSRVSEADTDDWTRIVRRPWRKYIISPVNTPFDKKDASKASNIKFTRKWSARNAFYDLNQDEVLKHAKETRDRTGRSCILGALQDATTTLWTELSPEVQEIIDHRRMFNREWHPLCHMSEDNNLKIGFNDVSSVLEDGKDFRSTAQTGRVLRSGSSGLNSGRSALQKEPPPKKDAPGL